MAGRTPTGQGIVRNERQCGVFPCPQPRTAATLSGFLHLGSRDSHQIGMYDHGFATLFLAEVYGMVPDLALALAAERDHRNGLCG